MAGRIDDGGAPSETHEINVTPFIDVMLVLLIVFMVAAPLATVSVPVDLPASTAAPAQEATAPVVVTLADDLSLSVGDAPVEAAGLAPALDALTGGDRQARIHLRADAAVSYGDLAGLMNALRRAGYLKVALVGLETRPAGAATP